MNADSKGYSGSLGVRGSIPPRSTKNKERVDRKVSPFCFWWRGIEPREFREESPHASGEFMRGLGPFPAFREL